MKKRLLVTASTVAMATSVSAADMSFPTKAPPVLLAAPNWAGPYLGFNVGVGWHGSKFYDLGDPTCCQLAFIQQGFWSPTQAGVTVGGQIGYNWQTGNFVYGLEGDLSWVDGKSSATIVPNFGPNVSASTNLDWFGTVRGRLGYATGPALFYVTGGFAAAGVSDNWGYVGINPRFSYSDTVYGWAAGGGVEYMISNNWTVKLEALYADFGTTPTINLAAFGGNYRSNFTHALTVVRGGLNWKW
jgi:outer membrane immunogenic protein